MSNVLFNTVRYFPHTELMKQRLLRYANTMPFPPQHSVIFEYVVVWPDDKGYHSIPAREYRVDVQKGTVEDRLLTDAIEVPLMLV